MISDIIRNIWRFILFSLLQVLVISHIPLSSYFILLPYVLVLLMLPFETPRILTLLVGFLLGLTMDMFYDTGGLHAAATTFMGFARLQVLRLISPREGYELGMKPTVDHMGRTWFSTYAFMLIFLHHFVYFNLEVFTFSGFFFTLLRIIGSSLATFIFIYVIQFLFYRNDKLMI